MLHFTLYELVAFKICPEIKDVLRLFDFDRIIDPSNDILKQFCISKVILHLFKVIFGFRFFGPKKPKSKSQTKTVLNGLITYLPTEWWKGRLSDWMTKWIEIFMLGEIKIISVVWLQRKVGEHSMTQQRQVVFMVQNVEIKISVKVRSLHPDEYNGT